MNADCPHLHQVRVAFLKVVVFVLFTLQPIEKMAMSNQNLLSKMKMYPGFKGQ